MILKLLMSWPRAACAIKDTNILSSTTAGLYANAMKRPSCAGPDPGKFPHGMKAVADYVHSKGLKFSMYSCAGNMMTCAGYPGSYEHEFVDAETFASWDVDFLKYDYCFTKPDLHTKISCTAAGLALENCGRDILFSACSWGADERMSGSKKPRFHGVPLATSLIPGILSKISWHSRKKLHPYNGVGCFNDMDMLIVGMHGKGTLDWPAAAMSSIRHTMHCGHSLAPADDRLRHPRDERRNPPHSHE